MIKQNFKIVFDDYFQKLKQIYNENFNHNPDTYFSENWNKDIIVSQENDSGNFEWEPKPQNTNLNWQKIELALGYTLNQNIKDFYSVYSFARFGGDLKTNKFENISLRFYSVNFEKPATECILQNHKDGSYYYKDSQIMVLGDACIDDNDSYFIFYDNKTDSLFCMDTSLYEESNHKQKRKVYIGKLLPSLKKLQPSI